VLPYLSINKLACTACATSLGPPTIDRGFGGDDVQKGQLWLNFLIGFVNFALDAAVHRLPCRRR
jgi:hypothetical protein